MSSAKLAAILSRGRWVNGHVLVITAVAFNIDKHRAINQNVVDCRANKRFTRFYNAAVLISKRSQCLFPKDYGVNIQKMTVSIS